MSGTDSSTKFLGITVAVFFFTNSLTGTFLPIYFNRDLMMSIQQIEVILFVTFLVMGLLPLVLLKATREFERIISVGILFTMFFYAVLLYSNNPLVLGLAYGLSMGTFWPSFNLLQFRLAKARQRAFLLSLLSSTIPSIAAIIGPAVGGFIIHTYGFIVLFSASIILYFVSFLTSLRIRYKPERLKFSIPKNNLFKIFMITFILGAVLDSGWLAYPLFVLSVSVTVVSMGFVIAASAFVMAAVNLLINRLSDVRAVRVEFAVASSILTVAWFFGLSQASNLTQVVALTSLSGLAGAFGLSWLAYYGDSFTSEYYASILVMREVGLMIGRMLNLIPTYYFITVHDYSQYFIALAVVSIFVIPLRLAAKKRR